MGNVAPRAPTYIGILIELGQNQFTRIDLRQAIRQRATVTIDIDVFGGII